MTAVIRSKTVKKQPVKRSKVKTKENKPSLMTPFGVDILYYL